MCHLSSSTEQVGQPVKAGPFDLSAHTPIAIDIGKVARPCLLQRFEALQSYDAT